MPPPRGRGRIPAVLLVICVLAAVVIGLVYYNTSYKPRHYLQDWSQRIGAPQGRFSSFVVTKDDHALTMRFSEQCTPSVPCGPEPVQAVGDWLERDGGYVDDNTIAQCFREGNSFSYRHESHRVDIDCDPVNTVQFTYAFTAMISY
jgi:hypothetical protein